MLVASAFLDEIVVAKEQQFPSVGHGTDYRYMVKNLAGRAVVHETEVIRAAFFRRDDPEQPDRMASYRSRRRHFSE